MCLQNEIVEALHAVTTELKAVQEHRDDWLKSCDAEIAAKGNAFVFGPSKKDSK